MGTLRNSSHIWMPEESEKKLNPLGRRIRRAMVTRGWSPDQFAKRAGLGSSVDTWLRRLTPDKEATNISMDVIVRMARAAEVSLVWLATGDGTMLTGPYAEPIEQDEMGFPDNLVRAVYAAISLTRCTRGQAIRAGELALADYPASDLTAEQWLESVRHHLRKLQAQSGERPSVRALKAGKG